MTPLADGVAVRIRVQPRARRNRIDGLAAAADGGFAVKLAVTAAPAGGAANAAVLALLAAEWGMARTLLSIAAGATGRRKTIHVKGSPAPLLRRMRDWLATIEERQ